MLLSLTPNSFLAPPFCLSTIISYTLASSDIRPLTTLEWGGQVSPQLVTHPLPGYFRPVPQEHVSPTRDWSTTLSVIDST